MTTHHDQTRSGFYRVNGNGLERVSSRVVALAGLVGAFMVLAGAVSAGVKVAEVFQRPVTERVVLDVIAPMEKRNAEEHANFLPKTDFDAYRWTHDAKDAARDKNEDEMRENFRYIRERLDRLQDARGGGK